jgi:hypothetical protein
LRGGKFSDFDGGTRTNAFVSGGLVPATSRGTVYEGIVSIADWYGLFCELGETVYEGIVSIADWYGLFCELGE